MAAEKGLSGKGRADVLNFAGVFTLLSSTECLGFVLSAIMYFGFAVFTLIGGIGWCLFEFLSAKKDPGHPRERLFINLALVIFGVLCFSGLGACYSYKDESLVNNCWAVVGMALGFVILLQLSFYWVRLIEAASVIRCEPSQQVSISPIIWTVSFVLLLGFCTFLANLFNFGKVPSANSPPMVHSLDVPARLAGIFGLLAWFGIEFLSAVGAWCWNEYTSDRKWKDPKGKPTLDCFKWCFSIKSGFQCVAALLLVVAQIMVWCSPGVGAQRTQGVGIGIGILFTVLGVVFGGLRRRYTERSDQTRSPRPRPPSEAKTPLSPQPRPSAESSDDE